MRKKIKDYKQRKIKTMSTYYIPLMCVTGDVTEFAGNPVTPEFVGDFIGSLADAEIEHYDSDEYYPDIVFTNAAAAPTITIAGISFTAELIAGSHPTYRPR